MSEKIIIKYTSINPNWAENICEKFKDYCRKNNNFYLTKKQADRIIQNNLPKCTQKYTLDRLYRIMEEENRIVQLKPSLLEKSIIIV